mmetsp:Transcript_52543/g.104313  ORF Transcript_52543/g.104313 Transcript_52543/m.104313 type:complete len:464 (+) Transcript_52543:63-1454(+)
MSAEEEKEPTASEKKVPVLGGIEKKEDFTEATATLLAESAVLAASGALDKAIESLFALEKKCRLSNDISSLKAVVTGMCQLCFDTKNWAKLNTTITILSKRHQQSRHAISALVALTMGWLTETPDVDTKLALLDALREVTDGKIFVEGERAKLTRELAVIKESQGDVAGACDAMLELYVETYGALSKREKIDFILEQVRLCIAKGDWVRVYLVQKKVQRKFLDTEDMQDLKLRFFKLLVEYHLHEKDAFELAQDYHSMYETPCKKDDDGDTDGWKHCLSCAVLFLVLAPRTPAQSDMLQRVALDEKLEKLPDWFQTAKLFTTHEIVAFPLASQEVVEAKLKTVLAAYAQPEPDSFAHWRLATHERTTQHNLRVAAKYYKRIRLSRLAVLLGLSPDECEKQLSALVPEGALFAKVDRPAGIVVFAPKVSAEETLSEWSSDLGQLLGLVERTCHLINKENMIHKI